MTCFYAHGQKPAASYTWAGTHPHLLVMAKLGYQFVQLELGLKEAKFTKKRKGVTLVWRRIRYSRRPRMAKPSSAIANGTDHALVATRRAHTRSASSGSFHHRAAPAPFAATSSVSRSTGTGASTSGREGPEKATRGG
jgi:hypothetical protein